MSESEVFGAQGWGSSSDERLYRCHVGEGYGLFLPPPICSREIGLRILSLNVAPFVTDWMWYEKENRM